MSAASATWAKCWRLAVLGLAGCAAGQPVGTRPDQAGSRPEPVSIIQTERVQKAFELRMSGDFDGARRVLDQALSAEPAPAVAWFESARLHFCMCEFDPASKAIAQAIKLDGNKPRYHFWAGQIATFNAVFKAHNLLGALSMPGQITKAQKSLERAVELKPDYHEARLELINLYWRSPLRSAVRAQQHLEELKRLDPVFAAKAQCQMLGGKSADEQVAIWKKVLAENNQRAEAHAGMGRAYRTAGKYQEAIGEFKKALELDPAQGMILFDIGHCHQALKNYDEQAKVYRRLLDMNPPQPLPLRLRAMRFLASAEEKRGNKQRAASLRKDADRLDPRYGKRGAVPGDVPDLFTRP
jgi:tetratricopeptide (TPR) repeat protein